MKLLERLVLALVVAVVVAMIGGALGANHWLLELLSHFQVQYFISLATCFIVLLLMRSYGRAALALVSCLVALSSLAPYIVNTTSTFAAESAEQETVLRVMSYNIFFRNTDYDAIAKEIEVQSPDILLLAEVEGDAYEEIAKRLGDYKYSGYQGGRVPYFDLAYFSRLPLTETVHYLSSFQIPTYELELSVGSKTLRLIGVHTSAPVSALYSQSRDEHLRAVAKIVNASTTPTLVIGDLNITPWSPIFKEFIDESGLAEARLGRGLLPSWNSAFAGPMRIPIDHILTKGAVDMRQIWTGSSSGSDHLPIIADLSI